MIAAGVWEAVVSGVSLGLSGVVAEIDGINTTTQIPRYVTLSIAGLLAGAEAGCIGGLVLGCLLAQGYHRHGPSDPSDAPVYVAMGRLLVGACLGAITGFIIAVLYGVRSARRRKPTGALQNINE